MSTPNLSAFERHVTNYAEKHNITVSRRVAKGIAKDLFARQVRMSDLELERVFMRADPTPPKAFRNIASNDRSAARRLGLVPA